MTEPVDQPTGLDGVLHLTAALTDRVLDAQIRGETIPEDQVRALTKAAGYLHEHGVSWPPMLTQALHEIDRGAGELPEASATEASPSDDLSGLSRFFAGFRKGKGEA